MVQLVDTFSLGTEAGQLAPIHYGIPREATRSRGGSDSSSRWNQRLRPL